MEIKTKYNIGDRVWIIYESQCYDEFKKESVSIGEVSLYDAKIINVIVDEKGIVYACDDGNYTEFEEEDIVLFEDTEKLLNKINELLEAIHKRESGNLQSS